MGCEMVGSSLEKVVRVETFAEIFGDFLLIWTTIFSDF